MLVKILQLKKALKKSIIILIIAALSLPSAALILFQLPSVQNFTAKRAAFLISKTIGTKVNVSKGYYLLFDRVIFEDISIIDKSGDTLLLCENTSIRFSPTSIIKGKPKIKSVKIKGGNFKIKADSTGKTNLDFLFKKREKKKRNNLIAFKFNEISIEDFKFSYYNSIKVNELENNNTMSFSNLIVSEINLKVDNLSYDKGKINAELKDLSGIEKSGFKINLSSKVNVEKGKIALEDMVFKDNYSKLNASNFSLNYRDSKSFQHFTDSVKIEAKFSNSVLNSKSLAYFSSNINKFFLLINFKGSFTGNISAFSINDFTVTSQSGFSSITLNSRFTGLPKIEETSAFVDIKNGYSTISDIQSIIGDLTGVEKKSFLSSIQPFSKINIKGGLAGLLTDFVANVNLSTLFGSSDIDVILNRDLKKDGFKISGAISADNFEIGKIIKNKLFGKVSFKSSMTAILRPEVRGGNIFDIDSLKVDKLEFNRYVYRNILAVGNLENNRFDGKVVCHDKNLDFIFQGILGFSSKADSYYDFYANILFANLYELNLDKRDSVSQLQFKTLANYKQNRSGDIFGDISVTNFKYTNSSGVNNIGNILLTSESTQNRFSATLESDFANANYSGNQNFTHFIKILKGSITKRHLTIFDDSNTAEISLTDNYKFDLTFKDIKSIASFVLPGFHLAEGSSFNIELKSGVENTIFKSNLVGYKNFDAENLIFRFTTGLKDSSRCLLSADKIAINNTLFDTTNLVSTFDKNQINIKVSFPNNTFSSSLNFNSKILFSRIDSNSKKIKSIIKIEPSEFTLYDDLWEIPISQISIQKDSICIDNLKLNNKIQQISVNGNISKNPNDSLKINIANLNISPLNFITKNVFRFKGRINGDISIQDWFGNPKITSDISFKEIYLNNNSYGDLYLSTVWNNRSKLFDLNLRNISNGVEKMNAEGIYRPENSYFDVDAQLSRFNFSLIESFLSTLISDTQGEISGKVKVSGPIDKLSLDSDNIDLENAKLKIIYTNVLYDLNAKIRLSENRIIFEDARLADRLGSVGKLKAELTHNYFKNLMFDTRIDFTNFECINTREKDNSVFYGNIYGTGNMLIKGSISKIEMFIDAEVHKPSSLHIPLSSTSEAVDNNLLRFTTPTIDKNLKIGIEDIIKQRQQKHRNKSELKLTMNLSSTNDALLNIEINKAIGNIITAYGTGLIKLDINTADKSFGILGDYVISKGDYQFNYALKQFKINEGGTLKFTGDIRNTNIDLSASYRAKASVNSLLADTTSIGNRRSVDCKIDLKGALLNPNITFKIDVPDLDPATKSRVDAALNTEDKVVRQVMSLLVTGSFIPDVQSSIVNNNNILYSNLTEILSNQINTIFGQLNIPLDLNFNYQQGNNGRDVFDAAISAQLLNNRVVVNGNIGNSPYSTDAGTITGDLEVEVKLDPKGKLRAKVFSKSADQFSNYLDRSQRNGVGVAFRDEFTTFSELLNKIFKRKRSKVEQSQPSR